MKIRKGHKYSGVIAQIVVSAFASLEAKGALLYTSGIYFHATGIWQQNQGSIGGSVEYSQGELFQVPILLTSFLWHMLN